MTRKLTLMVLLFLLPIVMLSQTGKIKGKVTEMGTDEPLIGANIIVVGTSLGAATDINGEFTITNVEAGVHELKASFVGFQSKSISNLRVNAGLTLEVNFELAGAGFTVQEVSVVAERPLVNKFATNANRISTSDDIEALPVRGVNEILSLTAGVTLQDNALFIRGGRLDEVGYYLEGASITDPVLGGRSVNIIQDAVEEIQVQSGGYTAEYGGANSGIVYTQIKSGTPNWNASAEYITDNISFQSRADRFDGKDRLGTKWYGYSDMIGTVSGPIYENKIKFFGLLNYSYKNDKNPQPYPGINLGLIGDPNTGDTLYNFEYPTTPYKYSLESMTGTATLTFDFNPFIFRAVGTFTREEDFDPFSSSRNAGNIANILNVDRIQKQERQNGAFSLKGTHIINATTFYELSGGYSFFTDEQFDPFLKDNVYLYGDSIANANVGFDVWDSESAPPALKNVLGITFNPWGDITSGYSKFKREKINLAGALSMELGKEHSIKIGGELQLFTLRQFVITNEDARALSGLILTDSRLPAGDPNKVGREQLIQAKGVNNYGYDLDLNEIGTGGPTGAKKPLFISGYIQDKIEYNNLIINAGLRFDYFDIDNQQMIDPFRPEKSIDFNSGAYIAEGWVDVPEFKAISPRLGFSFAVTDQTVFHAQYGKFVQQTRLRDAYQGYYATAENLRGGFNIPAPVGFNIRPTRTTQYEVGFTQQIGDFASFDITGYYKDVLDQIVFDKQFTDTKSPYGAYSVLKNGDFATTKGVEISFNMRRVERFMANATISFNDAQGTGSYPNSNNGIVNAPLDGVTIFEPAYVSPLEYNNSVRGNLSVDYRFGENDSPSWLSQFGISALISFNSGHPFTQGKGTGDLEADARDRQPVEALNTSTTPSIFQMDLRVDKTFTLYDKLRANIYVQVINLFDTKNIENVFLRTGVTEDDGWLNDPTQGGPEVESKGQDYVNLYQAINLDYYEQWQVANQTGELGRNLTTPVFYGPPRQIRLGIRIEY